MFKAEPKDEGSIMLVPNRNRLLGVILISFPVYTTFAWFSFFKFLESGYELANKPVPSVYLIADTAFILMPIPIVIGMVFGIYLLLKKQPIPKSKLDLGSGDGEASRKLEKYSRWNWGAFLTPVTWALFHRQYIGLLGLIPPLKIFFSVYYALFGYKIAWQNIKWESEQEYRAFQRYWGIFATIFILSLFFVLSLATLLVEQKRDLNNINEMASAAATGLLDARKLPMDGTRQAEWKQFASPDWRFRFLLPSRPSLQHELWDDSDGYQMEEISITDNSQRYFIMGSASFNPGIPVFDVNQNENNRLNSALEDFFEIEDGPKPIFHERNFVRHLGYPALEYKVDFASTTVYGRIVLWGRWVYKIGSTQELDTELSQDSEKFIQGFEPFFLAPASRLQEFVTSTFDGVVASE